MDSDDLLSRRQTLWLTSTIYFFTNVNISVLISVAAPMIENIRHDRLPQRHRGDALLL